MWDFVLDKSGAGAGFLREYRFPLPIYVPSAYPQSSSLSPEAGTIGRSANSLTNQIIKKKNKKILIDLPTYSGYKCSRSSVSKAGLYVIVRIVSDSIFNVPQIFIRKLETQTYLHVSYFLGEMYPDM
jgi:hypothetical protein